MGHSSLGLSQSFRFCSCFFPHHLCRIAYSFPLLLKQTLQNQPAPDPCLSQTLPGHLLDVGLHTRVWSACGQRHANKVPQDHSTVLQLMLHVCTREKSKSDLEVGGGEVLQEFDLHPEVNKSPFSSQGRQKAFHEEQIVRAKTERHKR